MNPGTLIMISSLAAIASVAPDLSKMQEEREARRYNVSRAPADAAHCIVDNTASAKTGEAASVQPLYGMERVAVVMKNSVAGEPLATIFLEPAGNAATAKVVTTGLVDDAEAFAKRVLGKC